MASLTVLSSPLEAVSSSISAFGRHLLTVCEEIGKARAANALYAQLAYLSDDELSERGLTRDQLTRTVYTKTCG